jgi:hypothetical protein
MQSMSVERAVSRSVANRERAVLATDSGVAVLGSLIRTVATNDAFLVIRSSGDDYIGRAISGTSTTANGTAAMIPLFTFATNAGQLTNATAFSMNALGNQTKSAPMKTFANLGIEGGNATATWVTLTNSAGGSIGRFAYWCEDLSSRINSAVAGNTNAASGLHARSMGTNVSEIPLFSLFSPSAQSDPGTAATNILRNRHLLPSAASLAQLPGVSADVLRHLSLLRTSDRELDTIPPGFGYADEGAPKANLNSLVASADVSSIAAFINDNLPSFAAQRRGGIASDDVYLRNIAASIIDYADADSNSTSGAGYRGIDAFPYVNEVYDHCTAVWPSAPSPDGSYTVTVRVNPYVEIWNPSNQPVNGTVQLNYDLSGQNVTVNGQPRALTLVTRSLNIALQPNAFEVVALGPFDFPFIWGTTPPASNANMPLPAANPRVLLELEWGGAVVDRQAGRMNRPNATTGISRSGANVNHWRGNSIPPSDYDVGQTADPRANFFNQASWFNHTYSGSAGNTSWKGRGMMRAEPDRSFNQQKPAAWPDGGTDTVPGVRSNNVTNLPTAAAASAPAAEPDKAPIYLSNSGNYVTEMELGNIFDPGQHSFNITRTGSPVDIPTSASASATAGGGITLAIGRREFSKFDSPGARASQLLDLFTANPRSETQGLLNINTATREALRALAVGLSLNRTASINATQYGYINPSPIQPPTMSSAADLFADAIIASRPFFSKSQLNLSSANGKQATWAQKFFGNPSAWTSGGPSVIELGTEGNDLTTISSGWNDRATESLLYRLYHLVTVRSRAFRVLAAGQAFQLNSQGEAVLDASGNPRIASTCAKELILYARPLINSTEIIVLYEKNL